MTILTDRGTRTARIRRSPHLVPLVGILVAVVAANAPDLFHLITANPLVLNADLTPTASGPLPGLPYVDGNAGFTMQALGHLADLDWLHGHIPWWNPYEGVGSPLAGEMQSGAFFPLTFLVLLHQGVLLLRVSIELVAGWSTYFLVRRLGVGRTFATAAGVAFGLCGTLAWVAHAPIRPVALLPLCLIGVERAIQAAREHRRGGWRLLAVALALSVLAGFPETSFIDGVFVVFWAVLRLAVSGREVWPRALARMVGGAVGGLALAAPLLVAFADYLPYGYVGGHTGGLATTSLPTAGLSQLLLPYSLGPIFGFQSAPGTPGTLSALWGGVGGFLSVTIVATGLVGLVGPRLRTLRIGLGAWILLCLLRTFGFPPVVHLLAAIPGLRLTAFFRYSDPSWELAVVVLAALGMDDVARRLTPRRVLVAAAAVTGAFAVWAAVTAWPLLTHAVGAGGAAGTHAGHRYLYPLLSLVGASVALTVLALGALLAGRRPQPIGEVAHPSGTYPRVRQFDGTRRRGRLLMAGIVALESIVLLGFTYVTAPAPTALHLGSVEWLQAHLGNDRFITLGPITPDYGSYFGIAEANINDLPVPTSFNHEIATRLDPNALPGVFSGGGRINPHGPTPAEELASRLPDYEAIGVRYVVESADGKDVQDAPFPAVGSPPWPAGPRRVYRDSFAEIWELPLAAPVFSLRPLIQDLIPADGLPASCRVAEVDWDQAHVHCTEPSILVRRVQYMPGWTATVRGGTRVVAKDSDGPPGLFQQVELPAGTTVVHFTFLPPHEYPAGVVALVALLVLVISLLWTAVGASPAGPGLPGTGAGTVSKRAARRYPPESTRGQGERSDGAPTG